MKKNILGLDLGTTSIGFAHVTEGDTPKQSSIEQIGVRVNPLTTDERTDFEKGRPISVNADRTLRRGMRRNLDRYQLRRANLIETLQKANIITPDTILAEDGSGTTHETWRLRASAVTQKIEKEELARVLLAINKKRGYKSSRKARNEDGGQIIDGMAIAKQLYEKGLTPGQLVYQLLTTGKKYVPEFYQSDLQAELDKVWDCQKQFYPEILTNEFYQELRGKGKQATSTLFWSKYKFNTVDIKDLDPHLKNEKTVTLNLRDKKRLQAYYWRSVGITKKLTKEEVAFVLAELNGHLSNSSGYLGAIGDRSKELYFNKKTVGQYLYGKIRKNPHARLKGIVFYRQDYLDEFEAIWTEQSKHYSELTAKLKEEVRDIVIFFQRKLVSQKGLIRFCEFESREIEIEKDKKKKKQTIGLKATPRSSPLFQEFKVWQALNKIFIRKKGSKKRAVPAVIAENNENVEVFSLSLDAKRALFEELNLKGSLKANKVIELLGYKPEGWEINSVQIEGNITNKVLYDAYLKILDLEGYKLGELLKISIDEDEVRLENLAASAADIKKQIRIVFEKLNINTDIIEFNAELEGKEFEKQPSYQLWHLLYSYEGDNSRNGNEKLYELLQRKFGFSIEHGKILANVALLDDHGSLSAKAIRKIFPFIKENNYSMACELAGYRHSASSLTKEEIANRPLKSKLELLKKNSLRNPTVEKILNQMVHVVNTLIDVNRQRDPNFKFDEIRIELARELKKNAMERSEMTISINAANNRHKKIEELLKAEFGIKNPSRNDIIRYKLYEELSGNGYKDIYTNEYIQKELLFSKHIDVDHIIPQARLFDDSFSNKTICFRKDNLKKGNRTAIDYIESEFGKTKAEEYLKRCESLFESGKKNPEVGINKAKFQKLQKRESEIGGGFIERDLRDTQYIAKKAKEILYDITRYIVSTSGNITGRLREDWGLVNIMQELNFEKYKKRGLTERVEKKDGTFKERIIDWSKRDDHRHHAMDALTVAFTKRGYIQYLNYLNARYHETHKEHKIVKRIEDKETHVIRDDKGNSKRVFNLPIPNFREQAKEHLENVLVSYKAKNKVVTRNKNQIKLLTNTKTKIELTPRGPLHKQTVYGRRKVAVTKEEKVGAKFNLERIKRVAIPQYKQLLLERLLENGNDPKKAFTGKNSIAKKPIFLNAEKTEQMPEVVKLLWHEYEYTTRAEITPNLFLDSKKKDDFFNRVESVYDQGIRDALTARYNQTKNVVERFNIGKPEKEKKKVLIEAFSDIDKKPIWLNEKDGICIKRVTLRGVKNVESLHHKKDHLGKEILDIDGKPIPVDFVSTGNNHHVAIYCDRLGNLQEKVVSFYEAVQQANAGLPVIDKQFNKEIGWQFLFSMKQNEYFVFPNKEADFIPTEVDLLDSRNRKTISPNLFRVQKIATKNYMFRHHLETNVGEKKTLKGVTWQLIQSPLNLKGIVKVRVNHIGQIIKVGEY